MADDINSDRRAELMAQKGVLDPIIRGLHDKTLTVVSAELKAHFDHEIVVNERRRSLVDAELAGMDAVNDSHTALLADGYPGLPKVALEQRLWDELQRENADAVAASAVFQQQLAVDFNQNAATTDVPQPVPGTTAG